jgi:hypothetical protein
MKAAEAVTHNEDVNDTRVRSSNLSADPCRADVHRNGESDACFGGAAMDGGGQHHALRASAAYMDGLLDTASAAVVRVGGWIVDGYIGARWKGDEGDELTVGRWR